MTILQGDAADPTVFYQTEEQVRQALRDDPQCGRAHAVLALTCLLQGQKDLVPREIDLALRLNPADLTAYTWRLMYDHMNGDYPQAIATAHDLIRRWPVYWPAHLFLAERLDEQGDTAGAVRESEAALEQDPRSMAMLSTLARIQIDAGELRKAREAFERIRAEDRQNWKVRLVSGLLLAKEGRLAEARREVDDRTQAYAALAADVTLEVAEFFAVTGDAASALQWLNRAVRAGDERESWFRRDPHLASIRPLPEFQKMLASVTFRREQRAQAAAKDRCSVQPPQFTVSVTVPVSPL